MRAKCYRKYKRVIVREIIRAKSITTTHNKKKRFKVKRPRVVVRAKCYSKYKRVIVREITREKAITTTHNKKKRF